MYTGLEIKIFSREPNFIFISFRKVFCMSNITFFGSLQKFDGAAGAFKAALGSGHPLISSPGISFSFHEICMSLGREGRGGDDAVSKSI